ncbi:MAG: hypothetical protein F3743_12330 [Nitrospinae bacterium]|nr:hypothetical protein [Nitrospinota bacterium]
MGFKKIFYLWLDLKHKGPDTHFFGQDPQTKNHEQTEFPRMLNMLEKGASIMANQNIEVYNCSPDTTLQAFPQMEYLKAVA